MPTTSTSSSTRWREIQLQGSTANYADGGWLHEYSFSTSFFSIQCCVSVNFLQFRRARFRREKKFSQSSLRIIFFQINESLVNSRKLTFRCVLFRWYRTGSLSTNQRSDISLSAPFFISGVPWGNYLVLSYQIRAGTVWAARRYLSVVRYIRCRESESTRHKGHGVVLRALRVERYFRKNSLSTTFRQKWWNQLPRESSIFITCSSNNIFSRTELLELAAGMVYTWSNIYKILTGVETYDVRLN